MSRGPPGSSGILIYGGMFLAHWLMGHVLRVIFAGGGGTLSGCLVFLGFFWEGGEGCHLGFPLRLMLSR